MKKVKFAVIAAVLGAVSAYWGCSSPTEPENKDTPTVTAVSVSPATANVAKGATKTFTATVTGTGNPAKTVTWSVTGGIAGTIISDAGALTVDAGETAATVTVTATSTVDNTKSGTAAVTVTEEPDDSIAPGDSTGNGVDTNGPGAWDPVWACPSGVSADGLDLSKADLGLDSDYVIIKFNGAAAATVTYSVAAAITHTVDGGHVTFTVGTYYSNNEQLYNIIVTGATDNGSLKILGGDRKRLYLNGVSITNPNGPAISIQSGKRVDVHLVGSCDRRNKLTGKGYETQTVAGQDKPEQAKAAFFSEGTLVFGGSGSLEVRSKGRHAIVSDGFIEVGGGSIIIYESPGDGIHANNRIDIKGGTLQIKCEGDAIQNERRVTPGSGELCPITVSGGDVKIRTTGAKGHGIVSDSNGVVIGGDATKIDITLVGNGSKGIRSHGNVNINGATVYIDAHGARESLTDDTSSASGIKADGNIEITRGIITLKSTRANENGKGLNVDGDLKISGGTTKITSDGDGVRVRGSINMTGGTLESKSANKRDIDCDGSINRTGGTLVADKIRP